ncbi:MAG: hypothetical protein PVH23_07470 [candidate division WOR-3 bacterium]|jgi:hypothetical protein
MTIFLPLYLKLSQKRFRRPFKPLGVTKKQWYLISVPDEPKQFFQAYPFIFRLSKIGSVVLLMPKNLEHIRSLIKPKQFEIILYEKRPALFSEDYKRVSLQLGERYFHFLIELNEPANRSLPYLGNFQRRVAFYNKENFPFFNIQVKNGYKSLHEFFNIESESVTDMFHFYSRDLKSIQKKLRKSHPLLFVNDGEDVEWKGGKVVLGADIMPDDPNIWAVLYTIDAYHGVQDAFCEFARINGKEILAAGAK